MKLPRTFPIFTLVRIARSPGVNRMELIEDRAQRAHGLHTSEAGPRRLGLDMSGARGPSHRGALYTRFVTRRAWPRSPVRVISIRALSTVGEGSSRGEPRSAPN